MVKCFIFLITFDNVLCLMYNKRDKFIRRWFTLDPTSHVWSFIFLGICFCLSSFFSCAETALLSVSKIRIRTLADEGDKRAQIVEHLLDDTDSLLSSILVGNNLVNIGASSLSTVIAIKMFGDAGAGLATGVVTVIILIFGEITPKSLAARYADKISLLISRPIKLVVTILKPIVYILNAITGVIIKCFGGDHAIGPTMTEEELKTYVTVSHEEGVIEEEEKEMIHNVFEFGDTEIKEIMTPRIHVISIAENATYDEVIDIYREQRFSRIPVHEQNDYDDIIGVLNVKDLLLAKIDKNSFNVKEHLRKPFVIYEFNHISDVFGRMRSMKTNLAVVLDEYGVMSGIVTLEDMIEEIVGEIDDEYDDNEEIVSMIGEDTYLIDGAVGISDINDRLNTHFETEDFESIGGMVLGEVNGVPQIGQEVIIGRATFTIQKIHKNRIEQLKMVLNRKEDRNEDQDD